MLIAVGTALLPGDGEEGRRPGPCLVDADGDLVEALLPPAADAVRAGDRVVVVTRTPHAERVRRAVRFCRRALGSDLLGAVVMEASPFRLAVILELLGRLEARGAVPRDRTADALAALDPGVTGLVVARSVGRLRVPSPRWTQRLLPPRRGMVFVARDDTADRSVVRAAADAGLPPGLQPEQDGPEEPAAVTAWVVPSSRDVDTTELLRSLAPVSVRTLPPDPCWWTHRGAPVTEIVLAAADVPRLARTVQERLSRVWRCYWCGTLASAPCLCVRCGADGRPAQARDARPALAAYGPPGPP